MSVPGSVLIMPQLLKNRVVQGLCAGAVGEGMRPQPCWSVGSALRWGTRRPLREPSLPAPTARVPRLPQPYCPHRTTRRFKIIPVYFTLCFRTLSETLFKCFIHVSLDCSFAKGLQMPHQLLTGLIPTCFFIVVALFFKMMLGGGREHYKFKKAEIKIGIK